MDDNDNKEDESDENNSDEDDEDDEEDMVDDFSVSGESKQQQIDSRIKVSVITDKLTAEQSR